MPSHKATASLQRSSPARSLTHPEALGSARQTRRTAGWSGVQPGHGWGTRSQRPFTCSRAMQGAFALWARGPRCPVRCSTWGGSSSGPRNIHRKHTHGPIPIPTATPSLLPSDLCVGTPAGTVLGHVTSLLHPLGAPIARLQPQLPGMGAQAALGAYSAPLLQAGRAGPGPVLTPQRCICLSQGWPVPAVPR